MFRRRLVTPLALLAAAALAVPAFAVAEQADACAVDPVACDPALSEAIALETRMNDHFFFGHALETTFGTPEKLPGDIRGVGGWGDSGLWTGVYLAGESYRYAIARDKLTAPGVDRAARGFWTTQRDEAKARIDRMVEQYHLLTNIGAAWRTQLSPSTDPPSFGGGVFQGEPGLLMRACAPTDAPPELQMGRNKRVFGPFPWKDGKEYLCETAPSRDTYAGVTFGLLTAFDLVGGDDPALAASIRGDILTMADRLVKYAWNYPRPHGNISAPPTGHDFDNFVSPLFVYVPSARLNIVQSARHVAAEAGTADEQAKWNAVWAEELATQLPILAASMEVDAVEPNNGYYKYNLNHLTMFNLIRLEQDPLVRSEMHRAMGVMDATTGDDGNAHFETITYAATGEQRRATDAARHLREWLDYRATIETGQPIRNSAKCGAEIECVPQDQLEVVAGGQVTVVKPGTSGNRARLPLPVADRTPTDFLWQRPPTQLDGQESPTHEAPGIDYLTPYWMLRYYTEVESPEPAPFPGWPVAHR